MRDTAGDHMPLSVLIFVSFILFSSSIIAPFAGVPVTTARGVEEMGRMQPTIHEITELGNEASSSSRISKPRTPEFSTLRLEDVPESPEYFSDTDFLIVKPKPESKPKKLIGEL